jgi:hypothetical protein
MTECTECTECTEIQLNSHAGPRERHTELGALHAPHALRRSTLPNPPTAHNPDHEGTQRLGLSCAQVAPAPDAVSIVPVRYRVANGH